jgi:hypothetical protein
LKPLVFSPTTLDVQKNAPRKHRIWLLQEFLRDPEHVANPLTRASGRTFGPKPPLRHTR